MTAIEAITFDLGDTLTDLGEGRGDYEARSLVRGGRVYDALCACGVTLPAREAFGRDFVAAIEARYQAALAERRGLDIFAALRWYFAAAGLPATAGTLRAAADAYCGLGASSPVPLRLGAHETLAALRSRGIKLGVISNTIQPASYLDASLARNGLRQYFAACVYSSEVGAAKPDPRIFQAALDALGVAPDHAVHVGDRLVADVYGAQQAGMRAVLIDVPHRRESDPAIVPDATIRELPELPLVLDLP